MDKSQIHRGAATDCDLNYVGYAAYDPDELENYTARVVHVDAHNRIITVDREVATLLGAPTAA
jgi:aspartate 1-decarboxylase